MSAFVEHTKRGDLKAEIALIFLEYSFYVADIIQKNKIKKSFDISDYAEKVMKLLKDYEV